ncbi:unnamed protein product (macronuclear) [Paramecium tetraurelia]|uniref:Uncharacterized protein n=1 Tax=Paramecium tetraurelia TaxID=5888 RepID=A0C1K7_PARTE|nr:uncharacterized protein GSPATT00034151001 [Paramecium tetraurelia]CAK64674.1 unnamed protein product [Paramecium tetraurelia]|eukprot:XP_001432071.1 hypothetical protein (macronuclear) [Paramecium tetraurelia strain d4-2]
MNSTSQQSNTLPNQMRQHSKSFSAATTQKLSQQQKKVERSYEEITAEKQLSNVEQQRLYSVFNYLMTFSNEKIKPLEPGITAEILMDALEKVDYLLPIKEAELFIWELDDDGDKRINYYEFQMMYKRCIFDPTLLEPRNLFNIVQFFMYDKAKHGKITVEDTLELLFVRHGRGGLDEEIQTIFGREEKNSDGTEKTLSFTDYYEKTRIRDFQRRKEAEQTRKEVKLPPLEDKK